MITLKTKLVNKYKDNDFKTPKDILEFLADQELNESYTQEKKEFLNRSKKLFDRYYDDIKKTEWMSGLTSDELFLNIKMRPKKLKKYFK